MDIALAEPHPALQPQPMAADVVLDCRWLGRGGVGMTTELTLRSFAHLAAQPGTDGAVRPMALRGDPTVLRSMSWPGTTLEADTTDPHARLGQSGWRAGDGRVELAFHQYRPLSRRPRLQWLHDTIPIHFAANRTDRLLRAAYMRRVVRTSDALLVDSRHTERCVIDELGADPDRITVITFPVDRALAADVKARRFSLPQEERLLFIGRFAKHKNIDRLIEAFRRSDFAAQGGVLHLVGGTPDEVAATTAACEPLPCRIVVEGSVPRSHIVDLLASSAGLIQPSLEEGFGLPVWEARTVGLPVIAADAGSLPELITDARHLFDPYDVDAMADAIDALMARDAAGPNEPVPDGPDLLAFGRTILQALESVAAAH